jgi:hypothetical protein
VKPQADIGRNRSNRLFGLARPPHAERFYTASKEKD